MVAPVNMTAYQGVFGANNNYSALPANMLNASAADENDFGTLVTNGIKGAAVNAINNMIGDAYASGQLQRPVSAQVGGAMSSNMKMLLIGGAVLLLMSGKVAT